MSGARAIERCDLLGSAPYSDAADRLYRAYLTPAHAAALDALAGWMAAAGMTVRLDPAANLIGRYEGERAGPPLLIGSHIDSVRDAGRYDGPLGIMLGIECVAALHATGRRAPFPIEIVVFGDEEGSRFPTAMLASRAFAGALEPAALDCADPAGVTLAAALDAFPGRHGSILAARAPAALAYLEAHIEQGPVLEAEALPVGVVTAIAAQARLAVAVIGRAAHAGTTPMALRRDALAAAAAMVLAVEAIGLAGGEGLVATVGRLQVEPGAVNVVPGRATFTLDIRAPTTASRDAAVHAIERELGRIAGRRAVALEIERLQSLPAAPCDPSLTELVAAAVADRGLVPRALVSGAGHDAMALAALCPIAMLFIRCAGGISHNPAESATAADADVALAVMLGFIDRLAAREQAAVTTPDLVAESAR